VEVVEAEISEILTSQNKNVSIKGKKEAATGEILREEAMAIKERRREMSSKSSKAEILQKPDAVAEAAVALREEVSEVARKRRETNHSRRNAQTKTTADKNLTDMVKMRYLETSTMARKDPLKIINGRTEVTKDQFSAEVDLEVE
jgi:hypothetical protein